METVTVNIIRTKCPKCRRESIVSVDESLLQEALQNPLGMVGVVEIHGDHALVIYIDRNGHERGKRIYPLLKTAERGPYTEYKISADELARLKNISGFALDLKRLHILIKGYVQDLKDSYKISSENAVLEIDFNEELSYKVIKHWTKLVFDAINTSYSDNPNDYLNAIKILDVVLDEQPFIYANKVFWLITNASTLTMRSRLPEKMLLQKYRPSIIYERYEQQFINHVVSLPQEKVYNLLSGDNPQIMFARAEALLSLYRRGVIDLVVE